MARSTLGTPATVALERAGIPFTSHVYQPDARTRSGWGAEAAEALSVEPATVFKTLVAVVDGEHVVAVVPVTTSLDLKALAAAHKGRRADIADAAAAQRLTGYVVGGISPVGQRRALPTYIDVSARTLPVMYVSGGRRGFDVGVAPSDLAAVTAARFALIGRT